MKRGLGYYQSQLRHHEAFATSTVLEIWQLDNYQVALLLSGLLPFRHNSPELSQNTKNAFVSKFFVRSSAEAASSGENPSGFQRSEQKIPKTRCFKITEKISFNIASEASYDYILTGQKLIKNAKNGPFWGVFENLKLVVKQSYQTCQF